MFPNGIDLSFLTSNPWILIALVVYMIIPANSPIKAWINKLIGGLFPTPTPTPGPGPTPTPGPVPGLDLTTLLQMLMNLLLKAKAAGDTKQQEAILATIDAVQAEQMALQKSVIPASMFNR